MEQIEELSYIEMQSKYVTYDTPLEDYIEVIIMFGYAILFGVVFPLSLIICAGLF